LKSLCYDERSEKHQTSWFYYKEFNNYLRIPDSIVTITSM